MSPQPVPGATYSPDGRWLWTGGEWVPTVPPAPGAGAGSYYAANPRAAHTAIPATGAWYSPAPATPPWVVAVAATTFVLLAVAILTALAIPVFLQQRAKGNAAAVSEVQLPACQPAAGARAEISATGPCAGSPASEAFRSLLTERCGVTLTSQWWQPANGIIAFLHVDSSRVARVQPATGGMDCG